MDDKSDNIDPKSTNQFSGTSGSSDFALAELSADVEVTVSITEERAARNLRLLRKTVALTKLEEAKERVEPEYPRIIKKIDFHHGLYKRESHLPTTPNTRYVDRAVWQRLCARGLDQIYIEVFWELVEEVRQLYVDATHQVGVICIVNPPDEFVEGHEIPPLQLLGKTQYRPNFLNSIAALEGRLFITFPLIRQVLVSCVLDLPECLIDFTSFRDRAYTLDELRKLFNEELDKARDVVQLWYRDIVHYVRLDDTYISPDEVEMQHYSCATGLLAIHLTNTIRRTAEHILEVTSNKEKLPQLRMDLDYCWDISFLPSRHSVSEVYVALFDRIVQLGDNLLSLESVYLNEYKGKDVSVWVPYELQAYYKHQTAYNITQLFIPVNKYVKQLNIDFAEVIDEHEKLLEMQGRELRAIQAVRERRYKSYDALTSEIFGNVELEGMFEEEVFEDIDYGILSVPSTHDAFIYDVPLTLEQITAMIENAEKDHPIPEEDITFEEGYAKVDYFRGFIDKLSMVFDFEYFPLGKLAQAVVRGEVTNHLVFIVETVASKLVRQHIWINEDICGHFEMLKVRALKVPETSEELIEMGEYMLWASTVLLTSLKKRIEASLKIITRLVEITTLTQDHIDLNSRTVRWVEDIKLVLEINAAMYEQCKFELTNEPPTGLQQTLLRSYMNDPLKNNLFYSGCPGKELMFTRMLYRIAFFHAVAQERRRFGPLGWNIPYGFNESFDISVQHLQMFVNEFADYPYKGICYLTGECNYGGRVTDDWDRRLIVTILADILNPKMVSNMDYTFTDIGKCYFIPRTPLYPEFVKHINDLPQMHPPEVFGLHQNAGITRDLQVSNHLLNSIILVQGEGSSGGGGEDALLDMVASDILGKLPPNFDLEAARNKFPVVYSESMNTVLVQEMERFTKLLNEIRSSLQTIRNAIEGLVVMTPALEVLSSSLLLGRIPAAWAKVSYPSLKSLPNYIADFVDRILFLQTWFLVGKPKTFWLSGFFFTQAFLTGAKQNFARKYTIPIDQLTFDFEVLKIMTSDEGAEDGVYVYGLFTDGARWDIEKGVLRELFPKILYDTMPLIWVRPITNAEYNPQGRYLSPLYKTSERRGTLSTTGQSTNYVLPFLLGTDVPSSHWVKRNVALLCQLD